MERLGSDQAQLASFGGGVISEEGAVLLSGESTGGNSLLFGPAALREIQAGVANGDFAIPPLEPLDTVTAENPLPYYTFTDVNSAGAITCAIVASASAGSGNVLRWSVAASTAAGKSATLSRFVPVGASQNRAFAYVPELNTFGATATANVSLTLTYQFYKQDNTTTGSSGTSTATFTTLGTGINWFNPPLSTTNAAPSDAAFVYIEIKVSTTATSPASISKVDITELRLIRGDQTNLFAEYTTPGTYAPTRMRQVNGTLNVEPNGGTGNVTLGGDLTISGGDLNLSTTHVIAPLNTGTVQFTRNDTGNRSSITVGRVFPGTQTTRYMDDDGTRISFNAGLDLQGTTQTSGIFKSNGSGYENDAPVTTTQTSSAAIWVLQSGTNYRIQRNSSSARYKTNIVDADDAVLEASRRITARHYESTIADEAGATRLGFIAEEVHDAGLTHAVGYDAEGRPESLDSTALIAALWHRVADLEARLQKLENGNG